MPSPRRTAAVAAALLVPLLSGCGPAADAQDGGRSSSSDAAAPGPSASGEGVQLADAIAKLKVAEEQRDGYDRDKFKHWISHGSGCDTRDEVLLAEAVEAPKQGDDCKLSGGRWESVYDGETVTDSSDLDIDHMVPLAEAWDSGAHGWTAERREQYANDLDAERSLIAVTSGSNRSKSDQDPAEWLPTVEEAHCTYAADWVGTKLRWGLAVDKDESAALDDLAGDCPDTRVEYEQAAE